MFFKIRIRLLLFVPLFAAVFTPRVLAVPAQSRAERELRAIYKSAEKAFLRRDANALIATETPDFRQRNQNGSVDTRAQADAGLRRSMQMLKSVESAKFTILSVKPTNKKALVSYRQEIVALLKAPDGVTARLKTVAQGRDEWIKTPRGWRVRLSETQSSKTTINDQPVG